MPVNRKMRTLYGIIAVAICATLAFGCHPASGPGTPKSTTGKESVAVTTTSAESRPAGQTLIVADTEGRLLEYMGNPAPIFAFREGSGELVVYCYESGSSHLPYVLNDGVETNNSARTIYIPEYDRSVRILFDEESGVWRTYTSSVGSNEAAETEWMVYYDREYIEDRTAGLRREAAPGSKPRYYSVESGLYYFFGDGGLTLALDMNGDGATEMVSVISKKQGMEKTGDYSVRFSGEEVFVIGDVSLFLGAYVTDVDETDDWKEVVFEYSDPVGSAVCEIVRYDGNSIRSKSLPGSIDCAGNGIVYQRSEDAGGTIEGSVAYEVDEHFTFREI